MLSYMKCGMAGCEKARKVSTDYCPEHEPTDTFEHWLERTGQNTKNTGAVALAKSAWNAALAQPVSEGRLRELVSDKIRAAARLWYASEPDKDLRERLTEGLTSKMEAAILPALESA